MGNSYFQVLHKEDGTYLRLIPATENGDSLSINEIMSYLDLQGIRYDLISLNKELNGLVEPLDVFLNREMMEPIRESYQLRITPDKMKAVIRFYPASNGGEQLSVEEVVRDLRNHNIRYGVNSETLMESFSQKKYCTDLVIAEGKAPRMGSDAVIQYFFDTDLKAKPKENEDGSVDFFDLSLINHCKKGDLLARLTPADIGESGMNVCGEVIKPRTVKKDYLHYGSKIEISSDRTELRSMVNGHVSLSYEKVVVSDVLELQNVDLSTGNVDYEGNILISGNVASNFKVKATGNIEVRGVVEGAVLEAGENITLASGMNGVSKGIIKAGGNVAAKYLVNAKVYADGCISTESILHSTVQAGQDIEVVGRKGFITGGQVSATNCVTVKTLGSPLGASTIIEVGINTGLKREQFELQKKLQENQKKINAIEPVLAAMIQKQQKGTSLAQEQLENMQRLAKNRVDKKEENREIEIRLKELKEIIAAGLNPCVKVTGEVFPGTKICIGDLSMIVKDAMSYCRFVREDGDVKICSL